MESPVLTLSVPDAQPDPLSFVARSGSAAQLVTLLPPLALVLSGAERARHRALCEAGGGVPCARTNANDVDKQVADAVESYLSVVLGALPTNRIVRRCKPRSTMQNTTARATLYGAILRLYAMGAREVPLSGKMLAWLAAHFAIKVSNTVRDNTQAFRAYIFSVLLQRARTHAAFSRD